MQGSNTVSFQGL